VSKAPHDHGKQFNVLLTLPKTRNLLLQYDVCLPFLFASLYTEKALGRRIARLYCLLSFVLMRSCAVNRARSSFTRTKDMEAYHTYIFFFAGSIVLKEQRSAAALGIKYLGAVDTKPAGHHRRDSNGW
jgi:hypothetical protein